MPAFPMPNAILNPADIEAIERATVAAVAPQAIEELDGWLFAFCTGAVNRVQCAVPLLHPAPDAAVLAAIESGY